LLSSGGIHPRGDHHTPLGLGDLYSQHLLEVLAMEDASDLPSCPLDAVAGMGRQLAQLAQRFAQVLIQTSFLAG
jgi:hypothetical protein